MIAKDSELINIAMKQNNLWDYTEFMIACEVEGLRAPGIGEWAQKMGMMSAAMYRWPDTDPAKSFINFIIEAYPPPK